MSPELKRFLISQLRRISYKWPPYGAAWKRAWVSRGFYKCAGCEELFSRKELALDHINPVVPVTGWDGIESYLERLFCGIDGYQVLCKDKCHAEKTLAENRRRRERRDD